MHQRRKNLGTDSESSTDKAAFRDREEKQQSKKMGGQNADVMKFYEAILDFMDRAFRLEPSTSTQP